MAAGAPAIFLFASEDGTFSGWNPGVNPNAVVVHSEEGAIYKSLAILGSTLYSADFGSCSLDTFHGNFFDGTFEEFDTAGGFADNSIPAGYCAFGGPGGRRLHLRDLREERRRRRGARRGPRLRARVRRRRPPDREGRVARPAERALGHRAGAGRLRQVQRMSLVGNFGDGRINAYCENNAAGTTRAS
jgi:hypothetical protein